MTPAISLTEAMRHPHLFGKVFAAESYWPWFAVAKLIDGLPLNDREAELFRACTGRTTLPRGPVTRLTLLSGRRAGKDRFMSGVAVHQAALAHDWRREMSAGETATALVIAGDRSQGRILRKYAEGLTLAPLIKREVVRRTQDAIEFRSGGMVEVVANDPALVRGRSACCVLGSEVSHWRVAETSLSNDTEVISAAEPSLALAPGGGVMILASSVYRKIGAMHARWKRDHGNDDADALCWLAPSAVMNPSLRSSLIEAAVAEDPERARAEFLSEWRTDLSDFLPLDVIVDATDFGCRERAPIAGANYVAFADAAGGTGTDSFTLAVAHKQGDAILLDAVREVRPRFIPALVVREFASLLRSYGIDAIESDRFGGGFHSSEWLANGIRFSGCERDTSQNYLAALPLLLSGRARLLDHAVLRQQLGSLERRARGQGRETVGHPQAASAHDDIATAACGALVKAAQRKSYDGTGRWMADDRDVARLRAGAPATIPYHPHPLFMRGSPWH
jgi:hypothetical protein